MDHKVVSVFAYILGLLVSAILVKLSIDAGLVLFVLSLVALAGLLTAHSSLIERQELEVLQSRTGFMTVPGARERIGVELDQRYLGIFLIHQNIKLEYLPGCDILANVYLDTDTFINYYAISVKAVPSDDTMKLIAKYVLMSITLSATHGSKNNSGILPLSQKLCKENIE